MPTPEEELLSAAKSYDENGNIVVAVEETPEPVIPEVKKIVEVPTPIEEDEVSTEDENTVDVFSELAKEYNNGEEFKLDDKADLITNVKNVLNSILEGKEKSVKESLEASIKENPVYKAVLEGGSQQQVAYTQEAEAVKNLVIEEEDFKLQEQLYRDSLSLKDLDEDTIDALVEKAKLDDKLHPLAVKSQEVIAKYYTGLAEQENKVRQTELAEVAKQKEKIHSEIKATISNGILGFTLTEKEQAEFNTYLTQEKEVKTEQGNYNVTDAQLNYNKLSLEKKLFIDYLVKTDFKVLEDKTPKSVNGKVQWLAKKNDSKVHPPKGGKEGEGDTKFISFEEGERIMNQRGASK